MTHGYNSLRSFQTSHDAWWRYSRVIPDQTQLTETIVYKASPDDYWTTISKCLISLNYFCVTVLSSRPSLAIIRYLVFYTAVVQAMTDTAEPPFSCSSVLINFVVSLRHSSETRAHLESWTVRACVWEAQLYRRRLCSLTYAYLTVSTLPIWNTMRSIAYSRGASAGSPAVGCHSLHLVRCLVCRQLVWCVLVFPSAIFADGTSVPKSTDTVFGILSSFIVTVVDNTSTIFSEPFLTDKCFLYDLVAKRSVAVLIDGRSR